MKFMMRFFVICILSLMQMTFAVDVNYRIIGDYNYLCTPENLEIKIPGIFFTEFTGQHQPGKTDSDVSIVSINEQKTDYLPRGMGTKYVNIESFNVWKSGVKAIARDDFKEMPKLKQLSLPDNKIEIIPSNCFDDLAQLEVLQFTTNKLITLPNKILHALPELRHISLTQNLFAVIPADLFERNPKLQDIYFAENNLKFMSSNILTNLKNLKRVDFLKNSCINNIHPGTSLDNLNKIIKSKCNVNPCVSVDKEIEKLQKSNKNLQNHQKAYDAEKNTLRANCPDALTSSYTGTQSLSLLEGTTDPDDLQQKYEELKITYDELASTKNCVCPKQNCAYNTELVFRHES